MAQETQKAPTPAPQEAKPAQEAKPTKKQGKKFSFSFGFLRKDNSEKAFANKVAPSRRELEAQAAQRRAQRAKMPGGLKQNSAPQAESEAQITQPA